MCIATECQLLAINPVILPEHMRIAKYLNPTPNLALSSQTIEIKPHLPLH
jgi:hypothetical protein